MKLLSAFLILASVTAVAAEYKVVEKQIGAAKLPFVRNVSAELDLKGEEKNYAAKADFSTIEKLAPLNKANLSKIQPGELRSLTNEEFNQLYARAQSGPMLKGDYNATVLQKSPLFQLIKKKVLKNFHLPNPMAVTLLSGCSGSPEDCLIELLWKGKRFLPKNNFDQVESQTVLNLPLGVMTLFPMNTYCGISQIDTRRESLIVDGTFADDFSSYVPLRDEIVTRKNLSITEEYRMIRPGLYIGKVYSNRVFMFNVALEQKTPLTQESINACFDGTKTR
jgi:hypothetical protein